MVCAVFLFWLLVATFFAFSFLFLCVLVVAGLLPSVGECALGVFSFCDFCSWFLASS